MKTKQRSFISNNSKKLSTYRPNSSTKSTRYIGNTKNNINNSLSDLYPLITFTMPSQKKPNRMGKQITKEELYEENMNLKDKLNKMRRELDETKNKLFKRELELNKKEKIINDCYKENVTEQTHEINLEKAKESALLTMCKQKYDEMKNKYHKKCEEIDILKANIKLTKLKEYKIQIDILNNEMDKLRNLYINSQSNYERSLEEIKKMNILMNEYKKQHSIITSLNNKYQNLSNEMNYIQQENNYLRKELKKNQEIQKKLKKNNYKLKLSNEKIMSLKKQKENSMIKNTDNIRKLKLLRKDLAEYKLLYFKQNEQYKNLLNNKGSSLKQEISELKPNNYQIMNNVESNQVNNNQAQLYKSLLEEAKVKNIIFENFLREHDISPEQIIQNKGYKGIMNIDTNKNIIKLTQKINKTSTNNSTNTKDGTSVGTKENPDMSKNLNHTQSNLENNNMNNTKKNNIYNNEANNDFENNKELNSESYKNKENNTNLNNETYNIINNNNLKDIKDDEEKKENEENIKINNIEENNQNNQNQDTMKITQSQNNDYIQEQNKETEMLAILHTFVKNLEANHLTKESLIDKIKQISLLFENKEEVTKTEFIEPFIHLFLESMKVTKNSDIQLINEFFNNFIDNIEGDTNRFFLELIDIFENIVDYTLVENEEEVLNAISMELQPYKEILKLKLEKEQSDIITFDNLRKLIEELNINLNDDYTEFLIYKMKEKVPENSSIFDLNYKIILEILDRNIINNTDKTVKNENEKEEKKLKENEEEESKDIYDDEEMNIQMSNKLSELKQVLKDNNTSLEEECKDKIKIIEENNDKKINGLNKEIFFGIMKKYNIEIEEEIKEAIFDLFKIDTDILVNSESELFLLDYDKLCSILCFDTK